MRSFFTGIYRFFVRINAFIGKEIIEVLRQTPLILTLVLGPFLILLLFGIGYRNEARPMRTLVVVQESDPLQDQFVEQTVSLGLNLIYEGTTTDQDAAMRELRRGNVELVAVVPPDAMESIKNNQQAEVEFYHNEIDPYQVSYVEYINSALIDEVNRQVVRGYAEQGQESAYTLEQHLANAYQRTQSMRSALQAGDAATAQAEQQQLGGEIDAISMLVGGSIGLLGGLEEGPDGTTTASPEDQSIINSLTRVQESQQNMGAIEQGQDSYDQELTELDQLDRDLTDLETQLEDFQSVEPNVLVMPFTSRTIGVNGVELQPADFFAPAVIVLLLQHLAVTFSALAIVREQRSGSIELFRISPLSAFETLVGKYLSYILFGGALGAIITATVILALKVPMLGSWSNYVIVLLTMLFTSLGIGFLISLLARTEMQAVQYAMFILLGSVFFSGFFLDLRYLWEPVRVVSWMLPATYAIRMLQGIMLRGNPLELMLLYGLLGIGVFLFIIAWYMLRRRLQKEWS